MKGHKSEAGSGVIDNLASLQTLDENSLLEEIKTRYHSEIIYVSQSAFPPKGKVHKNNIFQSWNYKASFRRVFPECIPK